MAKETAAPETPTFAPETIQRYHKLQRALSTPETFDEFLVNPEEVAGRYGVELKDQEIEAARNASHFLANWEFFCGDGQWVQSGFPDGGTERATTVTMADILARQLRERIAQEIVRDIPDALHRVISRVGSTSLVEPDERIEDLPEHVQPIALALRRLVRTMRRELNREISSLTLRGLMTQPTPFQPHPAERGGMEPWATGPGREHEAVQQLSQAVGTYLGEVINRAVEDAVSQVRPGMVRPFGRTAGYQGSMGMRPRQPAHPQGKPDG